MLKVVKHNGEFEIRREWNGVYYPITLKNNNGVDSCRLKYFTQDSATEMSQLCLDIIMKSKFYEGDKIYKLSPLHSNQLQIASIVKAMLVRTVEISMAHLPQIITKSESKIKEWDGTMITPKAVTTALLESGSSQWYPPKNSSFRRSFRIMVNKLKYYLP